MTVSANASVLTISDDLPLRCSRPVHSGKVRSVYWLDRDDSQRIIAERGYAVPPGSEIALMVISDRLSAFDCLWQAKSLSAVPGKGAALNAIAAHFFQGFTADGLAGHHLLEMPHPMLWVVRQARPLRIEAIARRYLTGSLWRAYEKGERELGGVQLPDNLKRFARLPELLLTPTTKGVLRGLDGIAENDDAPLRRAQLQEHAAALGFAAAGDVQRSEDLLRQGFALISARYASAGELLVDTKFEFGYVPTAGGGEELIFMDEVGTPDSSRIWRSSDWERGTPEEQSKEFFRAALLAMLTDRNLLLDPRRMRERRDYAASHPVPDELFLQLSRIYLDCASRLLGEPVLAPQRPREALLDLLHSEFRLLR